MNPDPVTLKITALNHHTHTMNSPLIPRSADQSLRRILSTVVLALVLGAGDHAARATDANPPDRLTYQGSLVDANGAALAIAAPVNYDVVFRIYDSQTGGNLIWAEKQTVIVSKGRFSVLLGEGAVNGSELRPALSSVFTGTSASDRFLELTATIGTTPLTITPRLQLVTSPYAFTAKHATALVSPNGSSLVTAANAALTVNGTVTATSFSGDGANLTGLNLNNLNATNITAGTLADARLSSNIPKLNATNTFGTNQTIQGTLSVSKVIADNVGLGSTGSRARLDVGSATGTYMMGSPNMGFHPNSGLTSFSGGYSPVQSASIFAERDIVSGGTIASFSDERIKRISGRSNSERDLASLLGIEVTDYSFIDILAKGPKREKKVIAQQVEKIYPQAVTQILGDVPDIYKMAAFKDGWVKLPTNLKKGERVRLIGKERQGIYEVLEVAADRFRTDFTHDGDQVFVFGREVKDFRTVDYTAISMLNVSATQELAKRQQELSRQVEALRKSEARIAELEQKAAQVEVLAQKASRVDGLEREMAELKRLVARLAGVRPGEQPAADVVPASVSPAAKQ